MSSKAAPHPFRAVVAAGAFVVMMTATRDAFAADGPGCDAGGCVDGDGDGFVACGCALGGTPCDCNDGDPSVYPGAPEACDSPVDTNCSGAAAEGCAAQSGCFASVCVPECIPLDDFGCPGNSHFARVDGGPCLCAADDCTTFGCAPGFICDDMKRCVPSCRPDVVCPYGQRCRGFGCVDPCESIVCPPGAACVDGRCTASCACAGAGACAPTEACDPSRDPPRCIEAACVGVSCPAGAHCEDGRCRDDCEGVVCPPKRVCKVVSRGGGPVRGQCVDLCSPDPCSSAFVCDWRTGGCIPRPARDGGLTPTASDDDELLRVVGSGWTCGGGQVAGATASASVLVAVTLAAGFRRRRRRR